MAQHKQAKKRNRQRAKRTLRNRQISSAMRTRIKQVRMSLEKGELKKVQENLIAAISSIDSAAQKGVINKKTGARLKSRLTKAVNSQTEKK